MKLQMYKKIKSRGSVLIFTIIGIFVFSVVLVGILQNATLQLRVIRSTVQKEQALHIAEAGINYYQWHLAHFTTDYQDGTGAAGPYVHDYIDKDTNQTIGRYSLTITPPPIGSTVVTIQSTGWTLENPKAQRTVTVRYGIPSLAKYGFLTNSDIWVGSTTDFYGEFHSNAGVHFDGTGNAPITSARSTYTCTSATGCSPNQTKNGIWGSAPAATKSFWNFPVPNVDFSAITSNLATMRTDAQANGIYLAPSSAQGYSLVFNSNGTITIYRVTSLRAHATGYDVAGNAHNEDIDYQNRTQLDGNPGLSGTQAYAMPTNGLIFVEDRVWVEGVVNGRAMVVAAKFPYNSSTAPSVLIPADLTYVARDGSHVLGLIGQKDVLLTYYAPDTLDIDAALIAQNGSFQRYNFSGSLKTQLNVYGSISSYGQAGVFYGSSGYQARDYTYDSNLLYGPPPSFPLSSSGYQQISWVSN